MMNNLLMDLHEDVFINNILLSKVMLNKSLLSLRCVCKYLRSLITSPAFVKMHLHHSTTSSDQLSNQLVLIDAITYYKKTDPRSIPYFDLFYSLKFNDGDDPCRPEVTMFDYPVNCPDIWGSCNGLLCLTGTDKDEDYRVCLWNPLTKEYKDLPPPLPLTETPIEITKDLGTITCTFYSLTYGFGYDRFIDDYKIIRCEHIVTTFSNDITQDQFTSIPFTEFQVCTLGTNTWRKMDNNPYKSYYVQQVNVTPMQFVNGAFHIVMSNLILSKKSLERAEVKIVSFDIEKEVFGEMQWPLSRLDYRYTSEIRVLRECLCVLEFDNKRERCCNVWMMMDYGVNESWTKLFTIDRNEVDNLCNRAVYYSLLRFCDNGDILIGADKILLVYDPMNKKSRRVELGEMDEYLYYHMFAEELDKCFYDHVIYMESLVSLNSGIYKGQREFQDEDDKRSELFRAFGYLNLD